MSATPFLLVCLLLFALAGCAGMLQEFPDGEPSDKALALFFVFMAVWAAGLLLQPSQTSF